MFKQLFALLEMALTGETTQSLDYYLTPQSQFDSMAMSNWYGQQAANAWMQHCQALRAQGYTGPIHNPLANTQTLMQANQELQQTYAANNQAWYQNQQVQSQAAQNYSQMQRDQAPMTDPWGMQHTVQPSAGNYQWVNQNTGQVVATQTYYPPNQTEPWVPLK